MLDMYQKLIRSLSSDMKALYEENKRLKSINSYLEADNKKLKTELIKKDMVIDLLERSVNQC